MSHLPDRTKTLNELDPPAWGEPEYLSHLVTTCYRLRDKPIGEFEVGDLRIMICQNMGLKWLVPIALEVLEQEPFVLGDFYPGDLLICVLVIKPEFWTQRKVLQGRMQQIIDHLPPTEELWSSDIEDLLSRAVKAFESGHAFDWRTQS
ncbi:MAG: contact-dependent growth inhibition system immunity protein [Chloroflexota bacterium]